MIRRVPSAEKPVKARKKAKPERVVGGAVRADEVFTRAAFCERTGLARSAVRKLKAEGLRVVRLANREWIVGADFISFVASHQTQQAPADESMGPAAYSAKRNGQSTV